MKISVDDVSKSSSLVFPHKISAEISCVDDSREMANLFSGANKKQIFSQFVDVSKFAQKICSENASLKV